ncbi:hypothetical protein DPMN_039227 [Dreissena polymorpha]|uniref:Uncharacterized protein n=1 Tax=Dreissena polymorpha TaxID=45954 RepID=A0A9D4MG65_DREPO|nr:hypothetical protein DPMN_039227 [Dreissena polymorpha]
MSSSCSVRLEHTICPGYKVYLNSVLVYFSIAAVEVFLQVLVAVFKHQCELLVTVKNIMQSET